MLLVLTKLALVLRLYVDIILVAVVIHGVVGTIDGMEVVREIVTTFINRFMALGNITMGDSSTS